MSAFELNGCTALITGASAGIGREFARLLASRASTLVLVARREDRLIELRNELLRSATGLRVEIVALDLSATGAVELLAERLETDRLDVDFLINNAGLGDLGTFAESDIHRVHSMLAVNISALTRLTHRLLPSMIANRRGAVLHVSSSASFLPIAGMAVYAATKAYVTSFSEALRAELRGSGVRVTALCPGPVHTEFTEVANRSPKPGKFAPEFTHVSAASVARAGLRAVERDRAIVIPGAVMKLGMCFVRLMPLALLRLAAKATARG